MTNEIAGNTTQPLRSVPASRQRLKLIGAMVVAILFLATLILSLSHKRHASAPLVWIEPGELARHMEPGPFTRLKYRILRIGPLWNWYMKGRYQILIKTELFTLIPEAASRLEPSSQCQTNKDDARAWILSPEEVERLKRNLKAVSEVFLTHAFNLTTYDGGQAQMSDGPGPPAGPAGATIDMLPRVVAHSLSLLLGATYTESKLLTDGATRGVATNLITACRVSLPNGGGLLLKGGNPRISSQTNYWLFISATAIDSRGNPKLL
jgi:hypothetical protein